MVREKNCNITPFVQLSPRLDDKTPSGNWPRVLQRSWMTARGKDVQLDSHQRCAQGYYKLHRCDGDRIGHNVPSYDRSHIGVEDKRRRSDPEQIGGSGDRYRRGNPHDSGWEDDIESIRLESQQGPDEELQDRGVLEWESVTILFPHHSILLLTHARCLLTWRGRHHYTNTSYLFIQTLSSFCFFDLSMDLANS